MHVTYLQVLRPYTSACLPHWQHEGPSPLTKSVVSAGYGFLVKKTQRGNALKKANLIFSLLFLCLGLRQFIWLCTVLLESRQHTECSENKKMYSSLIRGGVQNIEHKFMKMKEPCLYVFCQKPLLKNSGVCLS